MYRCIIFSALYPVFMRIPESQLEYLTIRSIAEAETPEAAMLKAARPLTRPSSDDVISDPIIQDVILQKMMHWSPATGIVSVNGDQCGVVFKI